MESARIGIIVATAQRARCDFRSRVARNEIKTQMRIVLPHYSGTELCDDFLFQMNSRQKIGQQVDLHR